MIHKKLEEREGFQTREIFFRFFFREHPIQIIDVISSFESLLIINYISRQAKKKFISVHCPIDEKGEKKQNSILKKSNSFFTISLQNIFDLKTQITTTTTTKGFKIEKKDIKDSLNVQI